MPPARSPASLWGLCSAAFLVTSTLWFVHARSSQELGWDFTAFYLAARLPPSSLYHPAGYTAPAREALAAAGVRYFPPYVRPPVFALLLRPLGWLPYWSAFALWAGLALACYLAALRLLHRILPFPPEALLGWGLFFAPQHAIWEGQDITAVLLLTVAMLRAFTTGRERLAGLLLGLAAYKFNLFLLLPLYLLVHRRRTALLCAGGVAAILAAASALLTPPLTYIQHLQTLPARTIGLEPGIMPVWRSWTAGHPALFGLAVLLTAAACWWGIRRSDPVQGFAIALTGSVLVSPHAGLYDLALLAVPIALAAAHGRWWQKAPALALLAGVPLWLLPARHLAVCVLLLLASLLAAPVSPPAARSA